MGRKVAIIAYGTVEDRQRLAALARLRRISASQWVIQQIRSEHDKMFDPPSAATVEDDVEFARGD